MQGSNAPRRTISIMSGAVDISDLVVRALILLFLFFCVASTPGVGRSMVVPVEEEHSCTRESSLTSSLVRRAERDALVVRASSRTTTATRSHRDMFDPPLLAVSGHCLSNGLRAPLIL